MWNTYVSKSRRVNLLVSSSKRERHGRILLLIFANVSSSVNKSLSLFLSHFDRLIFNETTALLPFHRYRSSYFTLSTLDSRPDCWKEPGSSSSSCRLIVSSSRESLVNSVEFFRAERVENKKTSVTWFATGDDESSFRGEPLRKAVFSARIS